MVLSLSLFEENEPKKVVIMTDDFRKFATKHQGLNWPCSG